jgi:hypothetical protein
MGPVKSSHGDLSTEVSTVTHTPKRTGQYLIPGACLRVLEGDVGYDERWGTRPWTLPFLRPRIPWKLATDLKQLRRNWWLCSVMIFRWCYLLPISWLAPQRIGGKLIAMLMKKLPPSLEMSFNFGKLSCSLCSARSHLYRASNYNFRNRQMGNQKQDNQDVQSTINSSIGSWIHMGAWRSYGRLPWPFFTSSWISRVKFVLRGRFVYFL